MTGGKPGRKPIYTTDAERKAAKKRGKEKTKNVTLDADLLDALNTMADELEKEFGFRPTLSQTVRHMIRKTATTEGGAS